MKPLISQARRQYHKRLLSESVLTIDAKGIPSNADKDNKLSVAIAQKIAELLGAATQSKALGQTSGSKFEQINALFLTDTFPALQNLRPGKWTITKSGNRGSVKTSDFAQYEHLKYLSEITKENPELAASLGNNYMVSPDIIIYRETENDEFINQEKAIVDDSICQYSDIRESNGGLPILHASVSAKWTIRSDRAQNSRTEALGLVRNRKGRLPHIVVVTAEPLPSRLASLALGTGDIDCVYHFALPELIRSVEELGAEDAKEMLKILIDGKRLKDISDLPLDLSV